MAPRRGRASTGARGDAALLAAERVLSKENDYRANVKKLEANVNMIADGLAIGGNIEAVLRDGDGSGEAATEFLTSLRGRLKALNENNLVMNRDIDCFIEAIGEVKTDVERRRTEGDDEEGAELEGTAAPPDYEKSIQNSIERIRDRNEEAGGPVADDPSCVEFRARLGEKEPKKKKPRGSRGGGDDEDDEEDLEVVNNHGDDVHALKCPISGMFFEDPVRNKVCQHTYSRAGLNQMIRTKKRTCPIYGCTNQNVTLGQVEVDEEMILKVRRFKKREEAVKRAQVDDDDDDEGL